tara:strand:- start:540 stop:1313 length:774 start_codon:yes stop_codon:yes gene_type:complete
MNFFFGVNQGDIQSKISIPKFQNSGKLKKENRLYSAKIDNNKWIIEKESPSETSNFFKVNDTEIDNHKIYFLATDLEVKNFFKNSYGDCLLDLNTFSNTSPSFRCNLKVIKKNKGFSSYQSEYPFEMTKKKGSILSSLYLLTNQNASSNYLLLRNIFYKPIIEEFQLYIIDIKKKEILFKEKIKSNYSNLVKIDNKFIRKDSYIFASGYLGIPIYLSEMNGNLSFEHTHPPHTYILNKNRHEVVGNFKKKIYEIINQ